MQEKVVVLVAVRVVDYRVGRCEDAPSLHGTHSRAVTGVVEELARHCKTTQFLGAKISFQPVEYQRANSTHIHPRTKHRDGADISQFRHGLSYIKFAYSHLTILTEYAFSSSAIKGYRLQGYQYSERGR